MISSSVRPPTSTSALGRSSVSGRKARAQTRGQNHRFHLPIFSNSTWRTTTSTPLLRAQMFRQLLGQIDRAMLAARAAKRHHQVLEPAALIVAHAGVHQRQHTGKELVHALLLVEIVDHRRVFAGERFEALFAPGIGKAARVENKSAAVARCRRWAAPR